MSSTTMPDLRAMLSENQTTLDRTIKRLEQAGLSVASKASPGEVLRKLGSLKLPKKVSDAQQGKTFDEIRRQIAARK